MNCIVGEYPDISKNPILSSVVFLFEGSGIGTIADFWDISYNAELLPFCLSSPTDSGVTLGVTDLKKKISQKLYIFVWSIYLVSENKIRESI